MLHEIFGDAVFERDDLYPLKSFATAEREMLRQMLSQGINSPLTSSAGRLFDAVAAVTGLRQRINFEGQAAMELEFAIGDEKTDSVYPFQAREETGTVREAVLQIMDWESIIRGILSDMKCGIPRSTISAKFHNTLVEMIVDVAHRVGEERVVLTGGCFQNRYLTERAIHRLASEGFRPYWHQRIPPNDGGIALGQIFAAAKTLMQLHAVDADTLNEKETR